MRFLYFLVFLIYPQIINSQELPAFFSDNMVLQQSDTVPFWGTDKPGQTIRVQTSWGAMAATEADEKGQWHLNIKTPEAGGPHKIFISGSSEDTLDNVLTGEVWFASGQSNMHMPLKGYGNSPVNHAMETIVNSRNPMIRFFNTKRSPTLIPLDTVAGSWKISSPSTSPDFSAVAYHFADQLQSHLNIPVGFITSSWGGSKIQAWLDSSSIKKFNDLEIPSQLGSSSYDKRSTPTSLYNGMVHPYVGFPVAGFLWYQGESDREVKNYEALFTELISSWRNDWKDPSLPFYFVQIAPFDYQKHNRIEGGDPAGLREAQLQTFLSTAGTGMVVTTDIGDCDDIHPAEKETVGKRLAYWALAETYDWDIPHQGPLFSGAKPGPKPEEVVLSFDHADMGFNRQEEITGFHVAGPDGAFLPAHARVGNGKKIIIWNDKIQNPKYISYGFEDCPYATLENTFGFPASPFRATVK